MNNYDPINHMMNLRNAAGEAADELKEAIDKATALWGALERVADDWENIAIMLDERRRDERAAELHSE